MSIEQKEHERIWLEPNPGDDPEGRTWCQHNIWDEHGVEYVHVSEIDRLQRENAELQNLADRLKLEAQGHAMEARTANSTICEIYQIVTGAKGEPGNWRGAEPVRKFVTEMQAALLPFSKAAEIKLCGEWRDDERFAQTDVGFYLTFGDLRRARVALASTGGERHANK